MDSHVPLGLVDRHLYVLRNERRLLEEAVSHIRAEEQRAKLLRLRLVNAQVAVNKLPMEVLSRILTFSAILYSERPWMCPAFGVCQAWRECAIKTPYIWRTIQVTEKTSLEKVNSLLERSRSVPLHIDISFGPVETPQSYEPPLIIHRFLGDSYHRCHILSISLDTVEVTTILPLMFIFSELRELHIKCAATAREPLAQPIELFRPLVEYTAEQDPQAHGTPRLRILNIFSANPLLQSPPLFIPQLINADMLIRLRANTTVSTQGMWSLLSKCSGLEMLDWTIPTRHMHPTVNFGEFVNPIQLASLRTLLLVCTPDTRHEFFSNTALPCLIHLEIFLFAVDTHLNELIDSGILQQLRFLRLTLLPGVQNRTIARDGGRNINNLFAVLEKLDSVEQLWVLNPYDADISALRFLSSSTHKQLHTQSGRHDQVVCGCPRLRMLTLSINGPFSDRTKVSRESLAEQISLIRIQRKRFLPNNPLSVLLNIDEDSSLDFGEPSGILYKGRWKDEDFGMRPTDTIAAV